MTTSYGHDQDAEPPTPDGEQPDLVKTDSNSQDDAGQDDAGEPASHPDPEPGVADHSQAGTDS